MITVNMSDTLGFLLVFIRVGFILMLIPVFGSPLVPRRLKVGLSLVMALLIFPFVRETLPSNLDFRGMVPGLFGEMAIGLMIGFTARMMFNGIQLAGQIVGYQMGFGIVNVIDPVTSQQVSIAAQFYYLFAVLLFLVTGTHRIFIQALLSSYSVIPPLKAHLSGYTMKKLVDLSANIFVLAVKVGAPVLAITLFTQVVLGIVARTVPQINVFIVGFPLEIGIGLIGIGLSLPLLSTLLKSTFEHLGGDVFTIMRMMGT